MRDPEKVKRALKEKIGKSSFTHKRALLDPGAKGDSFLGHLESSQQVLTYLVPDSSQLAFSCTLRHPRDPNIKEGCHDTEALGLFASSF